MITKSICIVCDDIIQIIIQLPKIFIHKKRNREKEHNIFRGNNAIK